MKKKTTRIAQNSDGQSKRQKIVDLFFTFAHLYILTSTSAYSREIERREETEKRASNKYKTIAYTPNQSAIVREKKNESFNARKYTTKK